MACPSGFEPLTYGLEELDTKNKIVLNQSLVRTVLIVYTYIF